MAIDTGLSDDELEKTVRLGDSVTFLAPITQLMGTRVTGAALDDRTGCAVLLRCAQLLKGQDMPRKVTVLFSSREEVGSQGAQTAAFRLKPDACIAVDVTFATQPGVSDKEGGKLGGGPMVGLSPVLSRRMAQKLFDLAKREQISVQTEVMEGRTGTTADSILTTRQGVPRLLTFRFRSAVCTRRQKCVFTGYGTGGPAAGGLCKGGVKRMASYERLQNLCEAAGVSGQEDEVREKILAMIRPVCDTVTVTPLGGILAEKRGQNRPKHRLMIDAHMDEVGLIITHIDDEGFLSFGCVGGIDRPGVAGQTGVDWLKSCTGQCDCAAYSPNGPGGKRQSAVPGRAGDRYWREGPE